MSKGPLDVFLISTPGSHADTDKKCTLELDVNIQLDQYVQHQIYDKRVQVMSRLFGKSEIQNLQHLYYLQSIIKMLFLKSKDSEATYVVYVAKCGRHTINCVHNLICMNTRVKHV